MKALRTATRWASGSAPHGWIRKKDKPTVTAPPIAATPGNSGTTDALVVSWGSALTRRSVPPFPSCRRRAVGGHGLRVRKVVTTVGRSVTLSIPPLGGHPPIRGVRPTGGCSPNLHRRHEPVQPPGTNRNGPPRSGRTTSRHQISNSQPQGVPHGTVRAGHSGVVETPN